MTRPAIGIVASLRDNPAWPAREIVFGGRPYVDAFVRAGGVPLLVPPGAPIDDLRRLIDGWLLTGGRDVDPSLYGEEQHPKTKPERSERTGFELRLLECLPPDVPVLGVCYGCQLINVGRGGSLHQHVPEVMGGIDHAGQGLYPVTIEPWTLTARLLGVEVVDGHSSHHQAIRNLGRGLRVTARADDGTVEGVEDEGGRWLVGVQWHPERTPEDPATQRLFSALVEEAVRARGGRESCGTW